jgi:radical SAM protein with 4Fe4S-binding SPASM domain
MKGYNELRTLYQTDSLYAWTHNLYFSPVLVEISPLHRCNQLCRYCYTHHRGRPEDKLSEHVLVDAFRQLAAAGTKAALLQGTGEPLLHEALPKAIEIGVKHKLSIALNTNGVLLTKALQEQILQHLFYIKFSVLDSDPQRYAYHHGCGQSQWQQLMENIDNAIQLRNKHNLGVALWATVYLFKDNFHDAYNIIKFYKEKGLDYIVIQEATYTDFSPAGRGDYASSFFSAAEINQMREKVLTLNDKDFVVKVTFPLINKAVNYAGMTEETYIPDFCHGPKFYAAISADGEVYPCYRLWGKGKEFSYGSIYEKTFEEIWKGQKRKTIEEFINNTPPSGAECLVCNHARLNEILYKYKNANTKWKEFII